MHDHPGLYSIEDIWNIVKAVCVGLVTVAGALGVIFKGISLIKAPSDKIIARIDEHETRLNEHDDKLKEHEQYLGNDKKAIDAIIESNRVSQKSLLAIMEQLMTGNSLEKLEEAKEELESFLINK